MYIYVGMYTYMCMHIYHTCVYAHTYGHAYDVQSDNIFLMNVKYVLRRE